MRLSHSRILSITAFILSFAFNATAQTLPECQRGKPWGHEEGEILQEFDKNGNRLFGVSPKQFDAHGTRAYKILVGKNGNIYLKDQVGIVFFSYDSHGKFLGEIGSYGFDKGQYTHVGGIALDYDDNVWLVAWQHDPRIEKFSSSGTYMDQISFDNTDKNGWLGVPYSIAFDKAGNVWTVDRFNHLVRELDNKGHVLKQFGSVGSNPGQLKFPEEIMVAPDGAIFVIDNSSQRLQKFDSNGQYLREFRSLGEEGSNQVSRFNLTFDQDGNMYAVDAANHRVLKYDQNGKFLRQFGPKADGTSFIEAPTSVGVALNGDVWVVNVPKFVPDCTPPSPENIKEKMHDAMKPEWLACKESSDCEKITYDCSERIAVNKTHHDQAETVVCRIGSCSWLSCPVSVYWGKPVCENNQCVIKPENDIPPDQACQKDSDCVAIPYNCNQASAVNVNYVAQAKDKLCKSSDCSMTDCEEFHHFVHTPTCMEGSCAVSYKAIDYLDPGGKKWLKRFMKQN